MRVIVTGAAGFIGWHLVEALASKNGDVIQAWTHRAGSAGWHAAVDTAPVEMSDQASIGERLKTFQPDLIVHLAAQSLPGLSWSDPVLTYQTNVIGAIYLLEAVRDLRKPARVLLAGSSAEYADGAGAQPIAESAPIGPNSPYAASKFAVDQLADLYVRRYELDIVRFRPFFLIGPRKVGDVCSEFAQRIVAVERGEASTVRVGPLDVVRDFMDVRDGVSGILRVATAGQRGEVYNISSGVGVRVADVLQTYRQLSKATFAVEQDPNLVRRLDHDVRIGDASKLRALGWEPQYSLASALLSVLDYWRSVDTSKRE
jgi:GDP-4-dehydro-6-deoxy-D-mannose reductase